MLFFLAPFFSLYLYTIRIPPFKFIKYLSLHLSRSLTPLLFSHRSLRHPNPRVSYLNGLRFFPPVLFPIIGAFRFCWKRQTMVRAAVKGDPSSSSRTNHHSRRRNDAAAGAGVESNNGGNIEASGAPEKTVFERRVLRSRYLAVKNLISGNSSRLFIIIIINSLEGVTFNSPCQQFLGATSSMRMRGLLGLVRGAHKVAGTPAFKKKLFQRSPNLQCNGYL